MSTKRYKPEQVVTVLNPWVLTTKAPRTPRNAGYPHSVQRFPCAWKNERFPAKLHSEQTFPKEAHHE